MNVCYLFLLSCSLVTANPIKLKIKEQFMSTEKKKQDKNTKVFIVEKKKKFEIENLKNSTAAFQSKRRYGIINIL